MSVRRGMDLLDTWPVPDHVDLRDRLLAAYDDPTRGYHDRRHLAEVVNHIELLRDELPQPERDLDQVLLAAWFHDAVYDDAGDLEERSAILAGTELAAAGRDPAEVAEVVRLVRLTAGHRPGPDDARGAVLCDADLAILAADEGRYTDYVAGVRRDYAHLDDDTFRAGRAAVLRDLAERPTLFHTATGRRLWEAPARANLTRELAGARTD